MGGGGVPFIKMATCWYVLQIKTAVDPLGNDPAVYATSKLTPQQISALLKAGPLQPPAGYQFPRRHGRCFVHDWFYKTLSGDAIRQKRNWLTYSTSTDKAFCLSCMIFGGPLANRAWAVDGWNDWVNGIRAIDRHEINKEHKAADVARFQWISAKSVYQSICKSNRQFIAEMRNVVSCVIDCIKYLAQEMMALRGHTNRGGKLNSLFRLLAKYNPVAAAYVQKLDKSESRMGINFLSPRETLRLLSVMKRLVVQKIADRIRLHQKCAIIADGTYDSSKKEATVLLLRYIELDERGSVRPIERLVDVFTSGDSSGEQLCKEVTESLQSINVDMEFIVGQGYDGAGNVRGRCQGLKTRIQEINPKAVYIWCHGHRFNLVVEATAACCPEVRNALGLLEELYVFFSGHKRNSVFLEAQKDASHQKQLKRVACTRWNSRQAAVDTTIQCYGSILLALEMLVATGSDSATVSGARGLSVRLKDIRFIITLFVLEEIFAVAGPASRQLQGVCMDLAMAGQLVRDCREKFIQKRSDNPVTGVTATWTNIVQKAKSFASQHGISDLEIVERSRAKRLLAGEEARDECRTGEDRLKVAMFIPVLDQLSIQLKERFGDEQVGLMKEMSLFSSGALITGRAISAADIPCLTQTYGLDAEAIASEYQEFCSAFRCLNVTELSESYHLQLADAEEQSADIRDARLEMCCTENDPPPAGRDSDENTVVRTAHKDDGDDEDTNVYDDNEYGADAAAGEYMHVDEKKKWILQNFITPLQACYQLSGYPHLLRLYWILCTLPVTSCSAERALSRLRIIKNRLRSTMCDQWMKALMVLASEKDILATISDDEIIDTFALLSTRLRNNLLFV